MTVESSISVDLFNPGQVFACLGFLEAADVLCGDAEGRFDWIDEADARFCLRAADNKSPFEAVLDFLARAEARALAPKGWRPKNEPTKPEDKEKLREELRQQEQSEVFPSALPETGLALPIQITDGERRIVVGHWADGSSRNEFKLYAGNRSALGIATAMQEAIARIGKEQQNDLTKRPLDITTPMRGSFNFDPKRAWTTIDAGYSPNTQKHQVAGSPIVEMLAAWGLENARPDQFESRQVRYAVWGVSLPPMLARAALAGCIPVVPMRRFRFELNLAGKNKIVAFAEEEMING